jgi:hypothetical protein
VSGAPAFAATPTPTTEDAEKFIVIKTYGGLEFKGELKQTTEDNYVLHTPYGKRTLRRSDVVSTRMQLTPEERDSLKSLLLYSEKAAIAAAAEADAAARMGISVGDMKDRARQVRDAEARALTTDSIRIGSRDSGQSHEEKIYRALTKKITLEFVDTPISEAIELIQSTTRLTIILAPKVRDAKQLVTLRVNDMEVSAVIKWITQLTETFAEVKDQAIYITDQPSKENINKEREEIILLAAQMRVAVDLPPEGTELTDADRMKIVMQLMEKEQPKLQDFPGPELMLDGKRESPSLLGAP